MADTQNTTEPTDEQVEAAARAMFDEGPGGFDWDQMVMEDPSRADLWREDAQRVLRAALSVPSPPAPDEDERVDFHGYQVDPSLIPSIRSTAKSLGLDLPTPDVDERETLAHKALYDWRVEHGMYPESRSEPSTPTPDVDTAALIAEAEHELSEAASAATPNQARRILAGEAADSRLSLIARLAAARRRTPTPKEGNRD